MSSLRDWFEPLLDKADITSAAVNGTVVLDCGDTGVAIDFHRRRWGHGKGTSGTTTSSSTGD